MAAKLWTTLVGQYVYLGTGIFFTAICLNCPAIHLKEHVNTDRHLHFEFTNSSDKNYISLLNKASPRKRTNDCRTDHYLERCHSTTLF